LTPPDCDIAVIGAGPAGSLAAALLKRRGYSVCILERTRFPRFVIGESLLPSCMEYLDEAGLIPELEQEGYLKKPGVYCTRGHQSIEFDFDKQFCEGWNYTYQVQRARFDQKLVDLVLARGVDVAFECQVTGFEPGPEPQLTWRDGKGAEHTRRFRFVLDGSGYGRVLPTFLGTARPPNLSPKRAVFAHMRGDIRPDDRTAGFSYAIWNRAHWLWLIPFADGTTSVGVVGNIEAYQSLPEDPAACLLEMMRTDPVLAARFPSPEFVFSPRTLDNYSASVTTLHGPGYCLIGNTGEFLDPIFSSGIMFAFASASRAAAVLDRQLRGDKVDWQGDYAEPMTAGIDVFRDYVTWWYDGTLERLFFSNPPPGVKSQICSVLAGYVWDAKNPFVTERRRKVSQLLRLLSAA
jgi:flavin-dependent dehydrogenase